MKPARILTMEPYIKEVADAVEAQHLVRVRRSGAAGAAAMSLGWISGVLGAGGNWPVAGWTALIGLTSGLALIVSTNSTMGERLDTRKALRQPLPARVLEVPRLVKVGSLLGGLDPAARETALVLGTGSDLPLQEVIKIARALEA